MRYHQLVDGDLAALAEGLGGRAVRVLDESRLSRHLLLLRFVADRWPADRRDLEAAVDVLARAQEHAPDEYGRLLSDPMVGAWLGQIARGLRDTVPPPAREPLHLGGVAAAAALRAGLTCRVTAHARAGRIALPTIGAIALDGLDAPVVLDVAPGRVTVTAPSGAAETVRLDRGDPRWRGLRELTARYDGRAVALRLDDGDPYRDRYHGPAADRLDDAELARWQALFAQAWDLLARHRPERADELASGLRVLVPLTDIGDGSARSATAKDSVAALGLTRPTSAADFAITLVHEFQHSKLTSVDHLVRMYEQGGSERHFAPWRTDPRPTGGLLQGVYAFLGVADTWRALRAEAGLAPVAAAQFAVAREQVRVGIEALESSRELTPAGRVFTAGMRTALDRLLAEPVPDEARVAADVELRHRRAEWNRESAAVGVASAEGHTSGAEA